MSELKIPEGEQLLFDGGGDFGSGPLTLKSGRCVLTSQRLMLCRYPAVTGGMFNGLFVLGYILLRRKPTEIAVSIELRDIRRVDRWKFGAAHGWSLRTTGGHELVLKLGTKGKANRWLQALLAALEDAVSAAGIRREGDAVVIA